MSAVGFLLDEHVSHALRRALMAADTHLAVQRIGDGIAPPHGTPDPEILLWIEEHNLLLLTNNRATMPGHLAAHLAQGRHLPGIIQLPEEGENDAVIGELLLIWEAADPEELRDRITYLPLR
jgi:hypothetical protein